MQVRIRAFIAFGSIVSLISVAWAQRKERDFERPVRHAIRGTHGAMATGSDAAAEAGMRLYFKGGNRVDSRVAGTLPGGSGEYSQFGVCLAAPRLYRTED